MRVSSEQDQWAGKGGFKQRHKAHNKSAMMETDVDRRSLFYNSYPNKNSEWFSQNKDNCKGNFQQLKQVIGIGYLQTKMTKVTCFIGVLKSSKCWSKAMHQVLQI